MSKIKLSSFFAVNLILFWALFAQAYEGLVSDDPRVRERSYAQLYKNPAPATPVQLLLAAEMGTQMRQWDDAAFFFYLGQMRNSFDRRRFPSSHLGSEDPQIAISALIEKVGLPINQWSFAEPDARLGRVLNRLSDFIEQDAPSWSRDIFTSVGLSNRLEGQDQTTAYRNFAREWIKEGRSMLERARTRRH